MSGGLWSQLITLADWGQGGLHAQAVHNNNYVSGLTAG